MLFRLLAILLTACGLVHAEERVILCLGDSLTSGYQIPVEQAWPHLVAKALKEEGQVLKVINAGSSGSTTASAKGRFLWHIKGQGAPDLLVLALGANDGLRGQDLVAMKTNLAEIIDLAKNEGCRILLAGMKLPPNYGQDYALGFEQVFVDLAREKAVPFIPFLLEGVAAIPELNLPDGIHPNARGHEIMAKTVFKHLRPLLAP